MTKLTVTLVNLTGENVDSFLQGSNLDDRSMWRALDLPTVGAKSDVETFLHALRSEYLTGILVDGSVVGILSIASYWSTARLYKLDLVIPLSSWEILDCSSAITEFIHTTARVFPVQKMVCWALDAEECKLQLLQELGFTIEARYDGISYFQGEFVDRLRLAYFPLAEDKAPLSEPPAGLPD